MHNQRKFIIITIISAALLLLLLALVQVWQNSQFRVVNTLPLQGTRMPTGTSVIKLELNKSISTDSIQLKQVQDPQTIVRGVEATEKTILIRIAAIEENKKYTINLGDVRSVSGDTIKQLTLRFTGAYIPYERLSNEAKQLLLSETDRAVPEDPLQAHLPHSTLDYQLKALNTVNHDNEHEFQVLATLYLSGADVRSGQDQAVQRLKLQIQEYIRSKGLDPTAYSIKYEIIASSTR